MRPKQADDRQDGEENEIRDSGHGHDRAGIFAVADRGGLAKYVTPLCRHPLTYDPELLMKGLALLYQMNAPQHHAGGGKKRNQNFRRARRPHPQRRERREDEAKAG